jgi:nucleoid-associated protein YgaU
MLTKKSRYKNALSFTALADGSEVFPGIRARAIGDATGVIEHEVQAGDRLDQLARHYYNDDRLWWRIVDANPEFIFGLDLLNAAVGAVILIPKAKP